MRIIFCIILSFVVLHTQAQDKNEVEKSIKKKDVPSDVLKWFKDAYEKSNKVQWFYQTDGKKEVYEAKLMHKNQKHSVEIFPNGEVVNIEILIDYEDIAAPAKLEIDKYFEANFTKLKIKKCQIQYIGSNDDLEDLIDEDEIDESLVINYEIEFYGRNENEYEFWEALFNTAGELSEFRKIKLKATDNLDY